MSILSQVTRGKVEAPFLGIIQGVDGVGKSSLGAAAPNPIFLGPESGTNFLDVARLPQPKSYQDVLDAVKALTDETHDYKTLVIDSIDWIEPFVWESVCKADNAENIEKVGGGFGKGYVMAVKEWQKFINAVNELRAKKGMHVILIAHSFIKAHNDPIANASYDRYILKLHEKSAAKLREWVDFVFFANFEVTTTTDKMTRKAKAFGDGTRYLYTERRPAFDAKSRVAVPFEIPLDWKEMMKAITSQSSETAENIKASCLGLVTNMKDDEKKAKATAAIERAGLDANKLREIRNRINEIISNPA
jgi:hypothetical protein